MTRWWAEKSGKERLLGHDRLTGPDPGVLLSFSSQGISGTKFGESFRNLDIQHTLCFIFEFDSILQTSSEKIMSGLYALARIEVLCVIL